MIVGVVVVVVVVVVRGFVVDIVVQIVCDVVGKRKRVGKRIFCSCGVLKTLLRVVFFVVGSPQKEEWKRHGRVTRNSVAKCSGGQVSKGTPKSIQKVSRIFSLVSRLVSR